MKIGFLASHRGSNMQAIIDACKNGKINGTPVIVISNNQASGALERARREGIAAFHVNAANSGGEREADLRIAELLSSHKVELVVLAGYMRKIGPAVLHAFPDRIINIHPALLPRHGGQGMYGDKVHAAVLESGDLESGVTIHLVNGEYDKGRILAQVKVPVVPEDTIESLSAKVLEKEHQLYVDTVARLAAGDLKI